MNTTKRITDLLGKPLIVVWLIILQIVVLSGFSDDKDEYTIKALFIYNFTKYIEWPEDKLQQQFKIGVWGEPKISDKLSLIMKGKTLYNRPVEIQEIKNIDDIASCQIIFIAKNNMDKLTTVLDRFALKEILVITDEINTSQKGWAINIFEKDQRMKFEINDASIKKAGLKVANQLFELAIVKR